MAHTMTGATVYNHLSNAELEVIFDGGSAIVVASHDGGETWVSAYVDADGLWISDPADPGYVSDDDLPNWLIDRPY